MKEEYGLKLAGEVPDSDDTDEGYELDQEGVDLTGRYSLE